jgi:hypothetical protein
MTRIANKGNVQGCYRHLRRVCVRTDGPPIISFPLLFRESRVVGQHYRYVAYRSPFRGDTSPALSRKEWLKNKRSTGAISGISTSSLLGVGELGASTRVLEFIHWRHRWRCQAKPNEIILQVKFVSFFMHS